MQAPIVTEAAVRCACGHPLVDAIDSQTILVEGSRVLFRRVTDHVVCGGCLYSYPVEELRRARGDAD